MISRRAFLLGTTGVLGGALLAKAKENALLTDEQMLRILLLNGGFTYQTNGQVRNNPPVRREDHFSWPSELSQYHVSHIMGRKTVELCRDAHAKITRCGSKSFSYVTPYGDHHVCMVPQGIMTRCIPHHDRYRTITHTTHINKIDLVWRIDSCWIRLDQGWVTL